MSNVLSDKKRQQIIALGRLGWSFAKTSSAVILIDLAAQVHETDGAIRLATAREQYANIEEPEAAQVFLNHPKSPAP